MILLIRSIPFTTPAQMTSTVRKIADDKYFVNLTDLGVPLPDHKGIHLVDIRKTAVAVDRKCGISLVTGTEKMCVSNIVLHEFPLRKKIETRMQLNTL